MSSNSLSLKSPMAAVAYSFVSTRNPNPNVSSFSGSTLKPLEQCLVYCSPTKLSHSLTRQRKGKRTSPFTVRAAYSSDGGRPNSGSMFVGGFVLGGIIAGTLGCIYAPQISKALTGTDKKDLMRKLPKFIYDEEKALEKTRKILTQKIEQLNSAIDDVSSQLRADDGPNGAATNSDEVEAMI